MKRIFAVVLVAFVTLVTISSCGLAEIIKEYRVSKEIEEIDVTDSDFDINNLPFDPHIVGRNTRNGTTKVTEQLILQVLDCFDNHDKEELTEMFAPAISDEYDLSYQIDKAFEIYDSTSVGYERLGNNKASCKKKDGIYSEYTARGELITIECENGYTYDIAVYICFVNDESPDEIGVYEIYLKDDDGVNLRIIGAYNEDEADLAE